jgi:hypothetical protein
MKVESTPDVQTIQRLDSPVVGHPPAPVPAKGVDELAHLFNQEVDANLRTLNQRNVACACRRPSSWRNSTISWPPAQATWPRSPVESACNCCTFSVG